MSKTEYQEASAALVHHQEVNVWEQLNRSMEALIADLRAIHPSIVTLSINGEIIVRIPKMEDQAEQERVSKAAAARLQKYLECLKEAHPRAVKEEALCTPKPL